MAQTDNTTVEEAIALMRKLSLRDQLRVMASLLPEMEQAVSEEPPPPRRSLKGILAHLGPAPSAEDIDEVRREMWANFPRDDIA